MSGIASCHHVLGVEHLLGEFWHGERSVLLGPSGCQGSEPGHEEVEPGEGNHVDRQLPEVSIELAREPEAGGHTGHGEGHQVVQVTVGGGGQLQGSEADVVESLVVDTISLVGVLHQLVDGQGGVVGLHHGVGHLGGGDHAVGVHDPVRILLSDLGDEECPHAGASASTQGVSQLESLKTIRALGLLPDDIKDGVDQLSSLGVVTLGPVVAGSGLTEHEVVGPEDLTVGAGPHRVHGAGLQVNQDGPGDVLATAGLVVVHIDPLQLEVGVSMVGSGGVDAVLVRDDLPELGRHSVSLRINIQYIKLLSVKWYCCVVLLKVFYTTNFIY